MTQLKALNASTDIKFENIISNLSSGKDGRIYMASVMNQLEKQQDFFFDAAETVLKLVNVSMDIFGLSCETHLFNHEKPLNEKTISHILQGFYFVP